jgi:hypothetical protein
VVLFSVGLAPLAFVVLLLLPQPARLMLRPQMRAIMRRDAISFLTVKPSFQESREQDLETHAFQDWHRQRATSVHGCRKKKRREIGGA